MFPFVTPDWMKQEDKPRYPIHRCRECSLLRVHFERGICEECLTYQIQEALKRMTTS